MKHECPLCEFQGRTRDRIRKHLHVSHRKFELVDALLDEYGPERTHLDTTDPGAGPTRDDRRFEPRIT